MNTIEDNRNILKISNARRHNLKSISVEIEHGSLTVVTGVSGSGKSSLVFDTIYAEGQRRYVESLSSYARQFLGRMPKPEVDFIDGLAPAIAIEQKVITRNPRSTVATSTEIYDYLKLLFTRYGKIYSPKSNKPVERQIPEDIWRFLVHSYQDKSFAILSKPPHWNTKHDFKSELSVLSGKGFIRLFTSEGGYIRIDKEELNIKSLASAYIVVDRLVMNAKDEEMKSRCFDSLESAFWEGRGKCFIMIENEAGNQVHEFSDTLEMDGLMFEEPSLNNMSFNSPAGACVTCGGLGEVNDIDPDLVIPDGSLSVYDDCVLPWKSETMSVWKQDFLRKAVLDDFPIHRAYDDLSSEQKDYLWNCKKHGIGLKDFFKYLEEKSYKIQFRVMLSRYRGRTVCPDCKGTKLKKEAGFVKLKATKAVGNIPQLVSLHDILILPVHQAFTYFKSVDFEEVEGKASQRVVEEVKARLEFLSKVGLGYLTLHRMSNTLSGGESQRIRLATALGSTLTGSLYVLDEPSIGLHPKDTQELIEVLIKLKDSGNTVIVVEHEEAVMRAADKIVDIGPYAGIHGGEITFAGNHEQLIQSENSLTAQYLTGKKQIEIPKIRRKSVNFIKILGAKENNLKNINVSFPLESFIVVTGVSGSGKTTLIKKILYPGLLKKIGGYTGIQSGKFSQIQGKFELIKQVELIDQNPLGRSSRSNPVTYVKAWDNVRELLSEQAISKNRKYKPAIFSFNVEGGRCEHCKGDGEVTIEMQFMADIVLPCEFCNGKRFKDEVLEVEYNGKNVSDILNLSVDEAIEFFSTQKQIKEKLMPLQKVGLGYIKLGQSTGTLSGGEAQRVKLASFLGKGGNAEPILFIFDEPTTGLHFHDIVKLLEAFQALVDKGHTLVVIEHDLDVIKSADYVIDLGPEGGDAGGNLVFEGIPEQLIQQSNSITGKFLKEKFRV